MRFFTRRQPLATQDKTPHSAPTPTVPEIQHILTTAEKLRYQRMLVDGTGVPLLADFASLQFEGSLLTVRYDREHKLARLHAKTSLGSITTPTNQAALAEELRSIRALQDAIMIEQDKHKREVFDEKSQSWKPAGFWMLEDTEKNKQLFPPVTDNALTDKTIRVPKNAFYIHRDHGFDAALPFAFRNFGNLDASTGLDGAQDIFIIRDGQILAITRVDMPDRLATVGGMNEQAMRNNAITRVLEVMEESLINSITSSAFYQNALAQVTQQELKDAGIALTLGDGESVMNAVANLPDDTQEARTHRTKICMALLKLADTKIKKTDGSFQTTFELLQAKIHPVLDANGQALFYHNSAEHRASSSNVVRTCPSVLVIDAELADHLTKRGLSFRAGDDALALRFVDATAFITRAWGGHGALLLEVYQTLQQKQKPEPWEQAFIRTVTNSINALCRVENNTSPLLHIYLAATRYALQLMVADLRTTHSTAADYCQQLLAGDSSAIPAALQHVITTDSAEYPAIASALSKYVATDYNYSLQQWLQCSDTLKPATVVIGDEENSSTSRPWYRLCC